MKCVDLEMRPGTVLSVLDGGKITASAPGLFSAEDKENLPPIAPYLEGARVRVDDTVWILNSVNKTEKACLYWLPKNNSESHLTCEKNDAIPTNAKVVCNESYGGGLWAYIIFEDGTGLKIQNNKTSIQLQDGNILISNGDVDGSMMIDLNTNNITIGSKGDETHNAAHGDKVVEFNTLLVALLNAISTVAKVCPYTSAIGTVIDTNLPQLQSIIKEIPSQNVMLQ